MGEPWEDALDDDQDAIFACADVAADDAVANLVGRLRNNTPPCIAASLSVPERLARYAEFPPELDPRLLAALCKRGVARLYSHQRAAWDAIQAGRHTVIVTPTASGKTLCYNLPVIHAALQARAKALYLFPTKALSQDQVAELAELNDAGALGVRAYTFDGDTPGDARKAVRTRGDIVVSNPDMLHQGILPHHTKWAQFFEALRFVVIDEMHTYRGVFGSHMANLLRRFRRVCRFYRVDPIYILCSATIANPQELASRLIGANVHAITDSGAPQGRKELLLWNPPVIDPELGIRVSARHETASIACCAVDEGLKTIVFAQSRQMVEVLTKYLKDSFDHDPRRPVRVRAYRGGYLPSERRATEKHLRAGAVDCVVATSALELGVDIGALDVCILNGYPGTIAGTWQRLGRAGRRTQTALGVLVATSAPLDQYLMRHPDYFLGASPSTPVSTQDQLLILMDHIRCAAFELPFRDGEAFGKEPLDECLRYLEEEHILHHEAGQWHWMADSYPANSVSLRSIAEGNFVVIDRTGGGHKVIAEVDYASAGSTLYEGAIYLIQAQPWQVENLDWSGRKAFVRKTQADYYTEAIDYNRLKILDCFEQTTHGGGTTAHGEVHLVRRIAGYKKIRYYSHDNVGYGQVNLPDREMHTSAVWWHLDPTVVARAFPTRWQALDGFLGAAHALHTIAALSSMCELRDLGRAVGNSDAAWLAAVGGAGASQAIDLAGKPADLDAQRFHPTVFLYDNFPGGIGLSAPLYDMRAKIAADARALVASCACTHGCPACIGPILASDERRSPKANALRILRLLAEESAQ
ncbi:MAG: DEAD/DEAH box helicase [Gammaproteobacteria bacterium]